MPGPVSSRATGDLTWMIRHYWRLHHQRTSPITFLRLVGGVCEVQSRLLNVMMSVTGKIRIIVQHRIQPFYTK